MHEQQRRAYLHAMGIVSYVPRFVLANAAPSAACVTLEVAPVAAEVATAPKRPVQAAGAGEAQIPVPVRQARSLRPEMPSFAEEVGERRSTAQKPAASEHGPVRTSVSFTAELVGSSLGLLFLTDKAMTPTDKRLVANIAAAYSRHVHDGRDSGLQAAQFRWPVALGNNLSLGAEAARDAFSAHLLARGERESIRALVLFGNGLSDYLDNALLEGEGMKVVSVVDLAELADDAQAKACLWRDLRALSL